MTGKAKGRRDRPFDPFAKRADGIQGSTRSRLTTVKPFTMTG